jgi:hypothetical protein
MRGWLLLVLAAYAAGCTNDYGGFRYPKGTGADGSSNTPLDAGGDAAPDGD